MPKMRTVRSFIALKGASAVCAQQTLTDLALCRLSAGWELCKVCAWRRNRTMERARRTTAPSPSAILGGSESSVAKGNEWRFAAVARSDLLSFDRRHSSHVKVRLPLAPDSLARSARQFTIILLNCTNKWSQVPAADPSPLGCCETTVATRRRFQHRLSACQDPQKAPSLTGN